MATARNAAGGVAKGIGRAEMLELPAARVLTKFSSAAGNPAVSAPAGPPRKVVTAPAPGAEKEPDAPGPVKVTAGVINPNLVFSAIPQLFVGPTNKTSTQLAQGAIRQLTAAAPAVVQEAVSTITNKRVAAGQLLNYLERKTRVGEVLNDLAQDWDEPTPQDFSEAFQMPATADKFPVMDTIVSIAILNDPDLRSELEEENTTEPTSENLMENRRIVWQWPEPGTPFTPPYVMMVAVEHQDSREAQDVVQSVLGDLVDFKGYKIPRATAKKL